MREKNRGKYLKTDINRENKKNGRRWMPVLILFLCLAVCLAIRFWPEQNQSIYGEIVECGYTGTQEQWLASLVGQETGGDTVATAYELACQNGYKESESRWQSTITGVKTEPTGGSLYQLACENGFEGTLSQWLTSIAEQPEQLGHGDDENQITGYELAQEYGYTGTFIEWLVSVSGSGV